MNIFYAPPPQISGDHIELVGQEAKHASKVLRYGKGDTITVVDGCGGWYEGKIIRILRDSVQIEVHSHRNREKPRPELVMAFGIIKKRDRLEFAVEKAVELGASELLLFRSRHTVKENVRMDRLENTVLSAMKQSLRAHLPAITVVNGLSDVTEKFLDYKTLVAHEKKNDANELARSVRGNDKFLLLVGPEGGFSEEEVDALVDQGAEIISLGQNRLRTETAVVALLSQFLSLD